MLGLLEVVATSADEDEDEEKEEEEGSECSRVRNSDPSRIFI